MCLNRPNTELLFILGPDENGNRGVKVYLLDRLNRPYARLREGHYDEKKEIIIWKRPFALTYLNDMEKEKLAIRMWCLGYAPAPECVADLFRFVATNSERFVSIKDSRTAILISLARNLKGRKNILIEEEISALPSDMTARKLKYRLAALARQPKINPFYRPAQVWESVTGLNDEEIVKRTGIDDFISKRVSARMPLNEALFLSQRALFAAALRFSNGSQEGVRKILHIRYFQQRSKVYGIDHEDPAAVMHGARDLIGRNLGIPVSGIAMERFIKAIRNVYVRAVLSQEASQQKARERLEVSIWEFNYILKDLGIKPQEKASRKNALQRHIDAFKAYDVNPFGYDVEMATNYFALRFTGQKIIELAKRLDRRDTSAGAALLNIAIIRALTVVRKKDRHLALKYVKRFSSYRCALRDQLKVAIDAFLESLDSAGGGRSVPCEAPVSPHYRVSAITDDSPLAADPSEDEARQVLEKIAFGPLRSHMRFNRGDEKVKSVAMPEVGSEQWGKFPQTLWSVNEIRSGYLVFWSGGKDCYLALHKALEMGLRVSYLLTEGLVDSHGNLINMHEASIQLTQMQSKALGIPIIQVPAQGRNWDDHEQNLRKVIEKLQVHGNKIEGVIAGFLTPDYLEPFERICKNLGIKAVAPLRRHSHEEVFPELAALKIRALVFSGERGIFEESMIGSELDQSLIEFINTEGAEKLAMRYHTVVIDAPLFRQALKVTLTAKKTFNIAPSWVIDVESCCLAPKEVTGDSFCLLWLGGLSLGQIDLSLAGALAKVDWIGVGLVVSAVVVLGIILWLLREPESTENGFRVYKLPDGDYGLRGIISGGAGEHYEIETGQEYSLKLAWCNLLIVFGADNKPKILYHLIDAESGRKTFSDGPYFEEIVCIGEDQPFPDYSHRDGSTPGLIRPQYCGSPLSQGRLQVLAAQGNSYAQRCVDWQAAGRNILFMPMPSVHFFAAASGAPNLPIDSGAAVPAGADNDASRGDVSALIKMRKGLLKLKVEIEKAQRGTRSLRTINRALDTIVENHERWNSTLMNSLLMLGLEKERRVLVSFPDENKDRTLHDALHREFLDNARALNHIEPYLDTMSEFVAFALKRAPKIEMTATVKVKSAPVATVSKAKKRTQKLAAKSESAASMRSRLQSVDADALLNCLALSFSAEERLILEARIFAQTKTLEQLGKDLNKSYEAVRKTEEGVLDKVDYFDKYLSKDIDMDRLDEESVFKLAYFSIRIRGAFKVLGITTIAELCATSENDFLRLKNFGRTSLNVIVTALNQHGLSLRESPQVSTGPIAEAKDLPEDSVYKLASFGVRVRKAFVKLNISTIPELCATTEGDFLDLKNFGLTSLAEIIAALNQHGLSLKLSSPGNSETTPEPLDTESSESGQKEK